MPLFNASTPSDLDKAGQGAKVIRDELKAIFNTKLEAKAIELISNLWECVKGWPRVFVQSAAPTPPSGAEGGRLWLDSDDGSFWAHSGSAWVRVAPPPVRYVIPLFLGVAQGFNTASDWDEKDAIYRDSATGNFLAKAWASGEGVRFNKAQVPSGAEIRFGVVGCGLTGTGLEVRLYDVAAAGAVTGTTLAFSTGDAADKETTNIAGELGAGDRRLRVQVNSGSGTGLLLNAELRIVRA